MIASGVKTQKSDQKVDKNYIEEHPFECVWVIVFANEIKNNVGMEEY